MTKNTTSPLEFFNAHDLIISATRYVLTRSSILVPGFVRELENAWPHMSEKTRFVVLRDIREHIETHAKSIWNSSAYQGWIDFVGRRGE